MVKTFNRSARHLTPERFETLESDEELHWGDFLFSPSGANNNTANGELLYHTGNTNADYFQIKMTPGDYFLVFDYGPSTRANTDHYVDGDALGRNYRLTRTKITLYYTLPAK